MGSEIDYEQMSDSYRRIKRRRAREKRRRKRRMRMIKNILSLVLMAGIVILLITALTGKKEAAQAENSQPAESEPSIIETTSLKDYELQPADAVVQRAYPKIGADFVSITASEIQSAYQAVYCVEDNKLLAGREATTRIYPASMTKVMTLAVAVETLDNLDETFEMTAEIIDPLVREEASRAGFDPGEQVTVRDLLYGLILPSGAECAEALAILCAGSQEDFAVLMNEKCEALGLKNTHFTNPSGLHDSNQYTTPLEMAVIMAYAMENETCAQVLSTYQYTTEETEQHPEGILLTSTMFSRMYGDEVTGVQILAGKTGYTIEAGNCLVSYAEKNNKHYVAVSAGATGKWQVIYDAFSLYEQYAN